ncbi:MAG TPA: hypothetical protein DCP03_18050, partial [Polaromonas sp.]|nr:hypothetical protein [Polaromonas sp.]
MVSPRVGTRSGADAAGWRMQEHQNLLSRVLEVVESFMGVTLHQSDVCAGTALPAPLLQHRANRQRPSLMAGKQQCLVRQGEHALLYAVPQSLG